MERLGFRSVDLRRPSASAVRSALDTLLSEGRLKLSDRNRRFLEFVVTEELAGRGSRIKAYAIGVDVFGRGEDFDPSLDPIVRIEATRVRSALSTYYETIGGGDLVRILIPPGGYSPSFEYGAASAALGTTAHEELMPNSARADRQAPAVVVTGRIARSDRRAASRVELLTESVGRYLSAAKAKVFVTPPPERKAAAKAIEHLLVDPTSVFALDIVVHQTTAGFRYAWSITDLSSGELLKSMTIDQEEEGPPNGATIDGVADKISKMTSD